MTPRWSELCWSPTAPCLPTGSPSSRGRWPARASRSSRREAGPPAASAPPRTACDTRSVGPTGARAWPAAPTDREADATSLLAVLGLGAKGGTTLRLRATGADADRALDGLVACVGTLQEL